MNVSDGACLQLYLDGGHHEAAEQLVERHLRLVYSAAVRCLEGDAASAADVTQRVFLDLFRKATELRQRESVSGWLHTAACHLARNHRRADVRRKTHENLAVAMSELNSTEEPEVQWSALRPIIDDALQELPEPDREAIFRRYFQDASHAAVGTLFNISEDAARMRIGRAMERIREALARRGIHSTATAIALALEAAANSPIPPEVKLQILSAIPQILVAPARPLPGLRGRSRSGRWITGLVATSLLIWWSAAIVGRKATRKPVTGSDRLAEVVAPTPPTGSIVAPGLLASPNPTTPGGASGESGWYEAEGLRLQIISAVTSQPISGGKATAEWLDRQAKQHLETVELTSPSGGLLKRPVESALSSGKEYFRVEVRAPGFATRNVQWFPRLGSVIPTEYVLRLTPAVQIGGRVVDPKGNPVPGATVNLYGGGSHFDEAGREFPATSMVTETDAKGIWTDATLDPALIPEYSAEARHPNFGSAFAGSLAGVVDQLLARQHLIQFPSRGLVRGRVTDGSGAGIPDAIVQLGDGVGNSEQRTTASKNGDFVLRNLPLINTLISASAAEFSPAALPIKVTTDPAAAPVHLVLSKGRPLRVRVVNYQDEPIAEAKVMATATLNKDANIRAPNHQQTTTDADGWCQFEHLPAFAIELQVWATGYMSRSCEKTIPGTNTHTVRVPPVLHLNGHVRDATGKAILRARILPGQQFPQPTQPSGFEKYFTDQSYEQFPIEQDSFSVVIKEIPLCNEVGPLYFKFIADGYRPHISRAIPLGETEAALEVEMKPLRSQALWVRNPDGSLATATSIAAYELPRQGIRLGPGVISDSEARAQGRVWTTDAEGRVVIDEAFLGGRLIAVNSSGVATMPAALAVKSRQIVLLPWARIEGEIQGVPADPGNARVIEYEIFSYGLPDSDPFKGVYAEVAAGFRVSVEANGRFVFPRVPPGRHRLVEQMAVGINQLGRPDPDWRRQHVEVETHPGQTTRVSFSSR